MREKLLELVTDVGLRFRREKRWARTARLKLRDADFETLTRQMPFAHPARDDFAFREAALRLFDREWPEGSAKYTVRLVGFGVANLQDFPEDSEPTLFADPDEEARRKRERLSETLDSLRERGLLR